MALSNSSIGANTFGSPSNGAVRDLPGATDWAGQDSTLKPEIWSELVRRDTKEKNVFKDFMGGEGANQPVTTKRDLSAGGKTTVTFTSTTPIRGQGVLGENQLKGNTDHLRFGTHSVDVDLIRHAVSYTQVLQLLRFTGKTLDQLSAELMADWNARKQQDDIQIAFRNNAIAQTQNTGAIGTWLSDTDNLSATKATLSTDAIEESKLRLIAAGAQPMSVDSDYSGADLPQYLAFAPANIMNELRGDAAYSAALQFGASRDTKGHPYFKGTLPAWENNVIFSHNLIFDTAEGRQGSPLMPIAFCAGIDPGYTMTAAAPGTAKLHSTAGGGTQTPLEGGGAYGNNGLDYFANFLGYDWQYTSYGRQFGNYGVKTGTGNDSRKYYATVYNTTSHDWMTLEYTSAMVSADGSSIDVANGLVIKACGNKSTPAVGNTSVTQTIVRSAGAAGSIIYQSDEAGYPLGFALHLGGNAIYYAEGSISAEPIYHYDDFATSGGRAHLTATGIQSVRGLAPFKDTLGRMPNFNVVQTKAKIVGVSR